MSIQRFVARVLWPWFRRYVWPIIEEYIIAVLKSLLEEMKRRFDESLRERRRREQEARAKAEAAHQAEQEAEARGNQAEAEVQKRVGQVWREVAEMLRQDNESLKEQLATLLRKADEAADQVKKGIDLQTREDRPALMLGGRLVALPEVTEGTADVTCPRCGAELR